jgi:hypothetical protein
VKSLTLQEAVREGPSRVVIMIEILGAKGLYYSSAILQPVVLKGKGHDDLYNSNA